jgi:hypothetical protein
VRRRKEKGRNGEGGSVVRENQRGDEEKKEKEKWRGKSSVRVGERERKRRK